MLRILAIKSTCEGCYFGKGRQIPYNNTHISGTTR